MDFVRKSRLNDLVSIVVPVYNVEKYIEDTCNSVFAQTYTNWELILVEDQSTDQTAAVIEKIMESHKDGKIKWIRQEKNAGAAAARNRGVQEAEGRFIAYLDADDIWRADKLEKELEFLSEKEAAFVFTGYEFADEEGSGTGKIVRVPETLSYQQALGNTTIFTSTVIFDTKRIPKSLLEMPCIKSEDTALWWKVLRLGYIAYGLDENLVWYRRPANSLSSNKVEALRRIWNLYRKAEGMGVFSSFWYFCLWAVRAVKRRV